MKTILVTGGAGFIGSHATPALLKQGYRVRVLDVLSPQVHGAVPQELEWLSDSGIEFVRGSVTCREDIVRALEGVHVIIHLAAETGTGQSMYEVARYNEVNSQGTALLLDVLANAPSRQVERIVLASSRSVYGEGAYACRASCSGARHHPRPRSSKQLAEHQWDPACPRCGLALTAVPTREDDRVYPASIYAATKYAQEELVRVAGESLGIGYAILRLQNVYGEGQSLKNPYTGILSIFSTRVRRGLELPVFEDGEETRDFVHVEDVTRAIVACVNVPSSPNAVMNVGSGIGTRILEIARQLSLALGTQPNTKVTAQYRVGDIRHNVADITKLRELLDCSPRIDLAEGMRRFAAWVQTQPLPEDQLARAGDELRARNLMG